jgi:NAD(P)-dependent dehydrogenase (short-subunit alcohol dehydrogenase family)
MGAAIARRLLGDGYDVVGIELDPDDVEFDLSSAGPSGEQVAGDAAELGVLEEAARLARERAPLAGWVNNAAVAIPGTLHRLVASDVDRVLRVNLVGVLYGAAVAVQAFRDQRSGGAIVNISSIQGQTAFPGWAAYIAAKGGVDALTRYIAVEYGPIGIRANAVAPGNVRTPMVQSVIDDAPDPSGMEKIMSEMHPLGRIGEPPEIAALAAFLISDEARFITGQVIAIDGGATARCYPMPVNPDFLEESGSG